ncbi:gamma-glutamylcyclotransferase [Salinicola avicenniae]|uniref:gamma-glutamylcyclotransferase n=1 Tax=Salinicola avicenniae TaxID=2916836 RepID=UPI002072FA7E|nr:MULTISPECIES: gamma-glutamylcyclotransferase [unclassified Salinicola]
MTKQAGEKSIAMTREVLEQDLIRHHFEHAHPEVALQSQQQLQRSIHHMLATAPPGARHLDGVYLFAYGSLIWNPCVEVAERHTCRLFGFHRDFCLKLDHGRGTPETPGLMLALAPGGSCHGVALRVPGEHLERELTLVWRREMLTGAYRPRWVKLKTDVGPIWGIAFVINPQHDRYIGRQSDDVVIQLLRTGRGVLGSCREYLDNTVGDLHSLGIRDRRLEWLQRAVRQ